MSKPQLVCFYFLAMLTNNILLDNSTFHLGIVDCLTPFYRGNLL
jgi:hypothetical protein